MWTYYGYDGVVFNDAFRQAKGLPNRIELLLSPAIPSSVNCDAAVMCVGMVSHVDAPAAVRR